MRYWLFPAAGLMVAAVLYLESGEHGVTAPGASSSPPLQPEPYRVNANPVEPAVSPGTPSTPSPAPGDDYPSPHHPYSDTDVDGDISLGPNGDFLPDARAISLFDYFFIESGRLSDDEILAQIHDWLDSRLREPALSQAREFLGQYLELRQLAAQAYAEGAMETRPRERAQLIYQLQQQAFGPALAAQLFGEQYQRQSERLDYMQALANGEHADPLQGLSPAESAAYQRTHAVLQAQDIATGSDSEEERWDKRSEAYGYEAAYRMAELDQRRSDWDQRLARYRAEKDAVQNTPELSAEQRAERLAELPGRHFNDTEQRRLRALEKIAEQQASISPSRVDTPEG